MRANFSDKDFVLARGAGRVRSVGDFESYPEAARLQAASLALGGPEGALFNVNNGQCELAFDGVQLYAFAPRTTQIVCMR